MRLCLRGQDIGWLTVGLRREAEGATQWKRFDVRPEQFLNSVLQALNAWNVAVEQLTSVAVVLGPGSFTALRDSLTIANTICYVHGLPIAGITAEQTDADDKVMDRLAEVPARLTTSAVPKYGAEPNITKPKN